MALRGPGLGWVTIFAPQACVRSTLPAFDTAANAALPAMAHSECAAQQSSRLSEADNHNGASPFSLYRQLTGRATLRATLTRFSLKASINWAQGLPCQVSGADPDHTGRPEVGSRHDDKVV